MNSKKEESNTLSWKEFVNCYANDDEEKGQFEKFYHDLKNKRAKKGSEEQDYEYDFFRFFSLHETFIRPVDKGGKPGHYRIRKDTAALFALIIKCNKYYKKKYNEPKKWDSHKESFSQYQELIEGIEKELDALPEDQRVFIQLHNGYRQAIVTATLVPKVVELFSLVMLSMFKLDFYRNTLTEMENLCFSLDSILCDSIKNATDVLDITDYGRDKIEIYERVFQVRKELKSEFDNKIRDVVTSPLLHGRESTKGKLPSDSKMLPKGINAYSIGMSIADCFKFFTLDSYFPRLDYFDQDNWGYMVDLFRKKQSWDGVNSVKLNETEKRKVTDNYKKRKKKNQSSNTSK